MTKAEMPHLCPAVKLATRTTTDGADIRRDMYHPILGFGRGADPIDVTELCYDRRWAGWELREDVPCVGEPVLNLAQVHETDENYIPGETILARAEELGSHAGQRHAEYLLAQHQQFENIIPEEWQPFELLFLGTVWGRKDPGLVSHLHCRGCEWELIWISLGLNFGPHVRVVLCR